MTSGEIRQKFLDFFEGRGHTVAASDLLVPRNDPTLLFTGAGMNQFKEQFMGKNITFKRAASCQKCFRTGDLDNVGKTPRHHTFFEMLGNFSFGDYFKKDAIGWAWEFMTGEMGIPEDRLWVSVYKDDEESYSIWLNDIKVPAGKIVKLGDHDNFWPADAPRNGPNGPCGPCSEIFYDWGKDVGCGKDTCDPACDCGRFVEVWNLVFTQFERKPDGSLDPLPSKNIDTGMGLERMVSVMQGVRTNFDTDLFQPIIGDILRYGGDTGKGKAAPEDLHLIADHVRAATFAIADGVSPSNEKQGYVVRKLIRRAYLRGGRKGPFLYQIVPTVVRIMKDFYPELEEKREHISAIVEEEEKRFDKTLESAIPVLEGMLAENPERLSGEQIFKLVDTYGLPLDVIQEETDVALDIEDFKGLMGERREQSRRGSDITEDFIFKPDKFSGVIEPEVSAELPLKAKVEFVLVGEDPAESAGEGERAEVVTSPQSGMFYAEGGGQAGDTGHIEKEGAEIKVLNTFEADGRKVLVVFVKKGSLAKGDEVTLYLDADKKQKTARNHTATHLLQAALRSVLGDQVKQSGSAVDDKRLRFDFTHIKKMSAREIEKVEDIVNSWIEEGVCVAKETKSIDEAKEEGALSFFGEKYGDTVRVVSVGDKSKELCGGTHVENTADIGIVKIINESAVASGIRRIEALSDETAREWVRKTLAGFLDGCRALSAEGGGPADDIARYADDIVSGRIDIDRKVVHDFEDRLKPELLKAREELKKASKKRQKDKAAGEFDDVKTELDDVLSRASGSGFVSYLLEDAGMPLLRKAAAYLEKKVKSGVVLLGGAAEGKASLVCTVSRDLSEKGISAREIIDGIAGDIDGGGGGKPTFAQAGGKAPDGLKKALEKGKRIVEEKQ